MFFLLWCYLFCCFFFKQKTAYEMRISDWSSDVCSSDLDPVDRGFDGFMDWDQIREMQAAGVTIGGHTASHLHMPAAPPARLHADAERALTRYSSEERRVGKECVSTCRSRW